MNTKTMRQLAGVIVLTIASAPLLACGTRADGAEREMPARPRLGKQIERVGRPLTGNALLGLMAGDSVSNALKEAYNRAAPADWPEFIAPIERGLAIYDGFDRTRGNQWLADRGGERSGRYHALAVLLIDDRLWIDAKAATCTQLFAVELAALRGASASHTDCGGRTPNYDAVDVFRSLLMSGTLDGLEDGVARDDHVHSTTQFPFLAAP